MHSASISFVQIRDVTLLSQRPYRNILARSQPPIDASQDITNAMATHENGITTVTFTRPLISNDPDDLSLTECRFFFYGWGGSADTTSRTIGRHESTPIISSDMVCLPSPTECESIVCGWSLEAGRTEPNINLVPRPLPSFLHSCEIKSGSGLGTRLAQHPMSYEKFLIFHSHVCRLYIGNEIVRLVSFTWA